jgi:hypothetical protein
MVSFGVVFTVCSCFQDTTFQAAGQQKVPASPGQPHYEVSRKDADNTFLQQKGVTFGFSIMKTAFLAVFLYSKPEGKYRVKEW